MTINSKKEEEIKQKETFTENINRMTYGKIGHTRKNGMQRNSFQSV